MKHKKCNTKGESVMHVIVAAVVVVVKHVMGLVKFILLKTIITS